jgi:hypothetical protein
LLWADIYYLGYRSLHWATYGTRPLWDASETDFDRIPFRVHPGFNWSSPEPDVCQMFGWKPRSRFN